MTLCSFHFDIEKINIIGRENYNCDTLCGLKENISRMTMALTP